VKYNDLHQHFQLDFLRANGHCDLVQCNNVTYGRFTVGVSSIGHPPIRQDPATQFCVDLSGAPKQEKVSAVRAPLKPTLSIVEGPQALVDRQL
jgi:hypothetical protein